MTPHTLQAQMDTVLNALNRPKTMLMLERETGIMRANICRYVAEWEKSGTLKRVGTGICPISKHRAGYYAKNI